MFIFHGLCCVLDYAFIMYLCFVAIQVLLDYVCIIFSTLVPLLDLVSLMQIPQCFALVECWTCKWYFALGLLVCMFGWSFLAWMIIVITIYSDCSCLVKPCFIVIFIVAWSHYACSICISRFLLTMIFLCYCFQKNLYVWFKSFTESRVRREWVLATVSKSHFKSRVCFRVLS